MFSLYFFLPAIISGSCMVLLVFLASRKFAKGLSFLRLLGSVIASVIATEIVLSIISGFFKGFNFYGLLFIKAILYVFILRFFVIDFMDNKKDFTKLGIVILIGFFIINFLTELYILKILF